LSKNVLEPLPLNPTFLLTPTYLTLSPLSSPYPLWRGRSVVDNDY